MTRIDASGSEADGTDGSTIAPLLEEVHAAEAAWRDGELPRLSPADRLALRAARLVLSRSRHAREQRAATDTADHTFEHRVEAGLPR